MHRPSRSTTDVTTRIDCENTGGYSVKPGLFGYEYCPFCGHAVGDADTHRVTLTAPP
ncbi:hypothetical protein [Halobaculum limi]|uniref:hypothetical protein n=1 Tax=Halobaculum limi TaxID=3031916 RepID=UPI00240694B4|nr:hypothetical protein [Halobaculum sp. YSMS11]